jgi:hypothetical protein
VWVEQVALGEPGGKGKLMDVTRIIAELRSEREDIERAILSLERLDRLSTATREGAVQSMTEISRDKEPDDGL